MRCILRVTFHFMTVFASPHTAQITFPLSAEKTATICGGIWTGSYKSGMLAMRSCAWEGCVGGGSNADTVFKAIFFR
jgi:hypothetical protein